MYEFYRTSVIGRALLDTIDKKVRDNAITPAQAQFILYKFDEAMTAVFNSSVSGNLNFKGTILSYNFVDGVWKFLAKDFVMTINNKFYRAEYMKIVACDADTSIESGRRRRKKA